MMHLLRSELFRLRKRPQSWILIIIMVAGVAAMYGSLTIAALVSSNPASMENDLQLSNIFDLGMQIVALVGFILIVVMASGLIGNEYSWNTIRPLLARSRSRSALLSAKWMTVSIYSIGLFIVGFLAVVAFSAIGSSIVGNFEMVSGSEMSDWVVSFGRIFLSRLPYAVLAFAVALITRSNAAGIAIGIGVFIIEPLIWNLLGLMTDSIESIRKFGLEYPTSLLVTINTEDSGYTSGDAWQAVAVLTGWVVVLVGLTYLIFNRRDVTSG